MRDTSEKILITELNEGPQPIRAVLELCFGLYEDAERTRLQPMTSQSAEKLIETAGEARSAIDELLETAADLQAPGNTDINVTKLREMSRAAAKLEIDARQLRDRGIRDYTGLLHWANA